MFILAKQNQIDIATALLEYGAEVNGQSRQGYTPIHLAADQGNTDMVALLIQHGGDANAGAKNQLRPLHLAAQNDHVSKKEHVSRVEIAVENLAKNFYKCRTVCA